MQAPLPSFTARRPHAAIATLILSIPLLTLSPGDALAFCGILIHQSDELLVTPSTHVVLFREDTTTIVFQPEDLKKFIKNERHAGLKLPSKKQIH